MPTDSKKDRPSQKGSKKDDFKVIKGVGEALDEWLRASFNVHTYAELAKLPARELRSRAFHDDVGLTSSKIKEILDEAKKLAEASQSPAPESGKPVSPTAEERPAALKKENEWKEFATFIINIERKVVGDREEKRTTISHHDTEGKAGPWPGIQVDQACRWMLERLGEEEVEIAPEEEAHKVEAVSAVEYPAPASVAIEITGIQVFQPPSSDQPQDLFKQNRAFTGFVRAGKPLSFSVAFQLNGDGASEETKSHKEFVVVFDAVDLFSSTVTQLGVSRPDFLKEGQFSYTAWIAPLSLSTGVYRLKIVTTIRDGQPLSGKAEVPLLQVA
ncbi:MAG: hypothetical protein MN733_23590 [Nitrososphaera sp.]|nr:hypothetical protein [Nitrososphaera sp.]